MDRSNHYEAAFEGYLQAQRYCYVAVDETRRATLGTMSVKNLDFIVHGQGNHRLLIDVKGRRFPAGTEERPRHVWECWSTRDDIQGLAQWETLFGPGYQGLLVFVYHVLPCVNLPDDVDDLWTFRGRRYLARAVLGEDYRSHMRTRSPRWGTVTLARASYRDLVQPFRAFTLGPQAVTQESQFAS
jgi:hypothetical protein